MKIELIKTVPTHPKGSVLCCHGICHGAWCWTHFLDYFYEHGYAAYALSYRGHGKSDSGTGSIDAFAADVLQAIDRIGEPVVLIGHSMGGAVVQKVIGQHEEAVSAAVLLASATAPRMRFIPTTFKVWSHLCLLRAFFWSVGLRFSANTMKKSAFFTGTNGKPRLANVEPYVKKLQKESLRVTMIDLFRPYSQNYSLRIPILVMGSDADAFFPWENACEQTAALYEKAGTPVTRKKMIGMCHDIMLDPDWKTAAWEIVTFLDQHLIP